MDVPSNPFTPGFGQVPYRLAGRDSIITEVTKALELDYRDPSLTSIFIGARGTGKTALMTHLSLEAQQRGWLAVDVVARTGMLEDIFQQSLKASEEFVSSTQKRHLTAVSLAPIGSVEWEMTQSAEMNWRSKMETLLDELAAHEIGLLITVDELDPSLAEVAELISTYQLFVRKGHKVALLLAGLPGRIVSLLGRKDVSFMRRAKRYRLGSIPRAEVMQAFEETVNAGGGTVGESALAAAADAIGGFAYMIQAVGYRSWNHCDDKLMTAEDVAIGASTAKQELEDGVLESSYYELSRSDRAFLEAMLEDMGDSAIADIAKRLKKSSSSVQKTRRRLINLGIIGERGRGFLAIELPFFKEYLTKRLG